MTDKTGYTIEAYQRITGEGNRTQERGIKAYYLVEQDAEMVSANQGVCSISKCYALP